MQIAHLPMTQFWSTDSALRERPSPLSILLRGYRREDLNLGREDLNLMRTIKEALYIRVNDPSLNKNVGKYHLPHVWDEVLFNTSELKLK